MRPVPVRAPVVVDLAFFVPERAYTQAQVLEAARDAFALDAAAEAALRRLFERSGVGTRRAVAPLERVFGPASFEDRNDASAAACVVGATSIARRLLGDRLASPDACVSASCTSYLIPSIDSRVAHELGFGPRLARLPITASGCAGGAVALSRAADFLAARPGGTALVLAAEACSLTLRRNDAGRVNRVATALFGDGGGGALLAGPDHPLAQSGVYRLRATASWFFPESLEMMGFRLRDDGLELILDRRLPGFLAGRLAPLLTEFLDGHGLTRDDVGAFAVHPGGRAVLDAVEAELALPPGGLDSSRAVLRDHGNMSSATIFYVLADVARRVGPGDLVASIGFGPGFGVELGLFERLDAPAPPIRDAAAA